MKTKYFTEEEMTHSATGKKLKIVNSIPDIHRSAVLNTMQKMDIIREYLGHPIEVLSGYRSSELNKAVKGSANSWHCKGQAVDFICPKFGTPYEVCKAVLELAHKNPEVRFHELIHEYGTWVHVAFPLPGRKADMEILTVTKKGTVWGLNK